MFSKVPLLNIRHSKLLDPVFIEFCKNYPNPTWKNWIPPTDEEVGKSVEEYKKVWANYGNLILKSLEKILSLKFGRNIIDVHIVKGTPYGTSHPIIIRSMLKPDSFLLTLTHELIHVLLQDNNNIASWDCIEYVDSRFPKESEKTKKHLVVFSVMKYVWEEKLNQSGKLKQDIDLLKESIGTNSKNTDYLRAWEIIESINHQTLIDEYKERYY